MKIIRGITNFVCATIVAIIFLYFVISVAMLLFIFTGQLTVGQPMYIDMMTPSITNILKFQLVCILMISVCVLIRVKVGKKYDFKFLQPKNS
jgi:hypothetical protein